MILDKAYTKSQARGIESWSQGTTSAIKYVTARYKNSFPFNFLLYNNFISNLFKKKQKRFQQLGFIILHKDTLARRTEQGLNHKPCD